MFRWFINLFRRSSVEERQQRDVEASQAAGYRMISSVIKLPEVEPCKYEFVQGQGVIFDGRDQIPWMSHWSWPGAKIGGLYYERYHKIVIPTWGGRWHYPTVKHEAGGHANLVQGAGIRDHDHRFDRFFFGWAETRQSLGYSVMGIKAQDRIKIKHDRHNTPDGDIIVDIIDEY